MKSYSKFLNKTIKENQDVLKGIDQEINKIVDDWIKSLKMELIKGVPNQKGLWEKFRDFFGNLFKKNENFQFLSENKDFNFLPFTLNEYKDFRQNIDDLEKEIYTEANYDKNLFPHLMQVIDKFGNQLKDKLASTVRNRLSSKVKVDQKKAPSDPNIQYIGMGFQSPPLPKEPESKLSGMAPPPTENPSVGSNGFNSEEAPSIDTTTINATGGKDAIDLQNPGLGVHRWGNPKVATGRKFGGIRQRRGQGPKGKLIDTTGGKVAIDPIDTTNATGGKVAIDPTDTTNATGGKVAIDPIDTTNATGGKVSINPIDTTNKSINSTSDQRKFSNFVEDKDLKKLVDQYKKSTNVQKISEEIKNYDSTEIKDYLASFLNFQEEAYKKIKQLSKKTDKRSFYPKTIKDFDLDLKKLWNKVEEIMVELNSKYDVNIDKAYAYMEKLFNSLSKNKPDSKIANDHQGDSPEAIFEYPDFTDIDS
jgi:hypothetical protein